MIRHRRALYKVTDDKQDGEQVTSNKQKRRADSTAVIAQLAALFPKAFAVNHHERKPLKIGIDADIVARGVAIEPRALWRPLRVYCASFGYLRTITAGAERVDLDGNPAGVVDERVGGQNRAAAVRCRSESTTASPAAFAPVILFLSIRGRARVMGIYWVGPATDDFGPASQCYGGRAHMADWVSAGDH